MSKSEIIGRVKRLDTINGLSYVVFNIEALKDQDLLDIFKMINHKSMTKVTIEEL